MVVMTFVDSVPNARQFDCRVVAHVVTKVSRSTTIFVDPFGRYGRCSCGWSNQHCALIFLESSWAGEPLVCTDRVTDAGLKHESISGIDSLRIHHATIGEMAGFVDGPFERD